MSARLVFSMFAALALTGLAAGGAHAEGARTKAVTDFTIRSEASGASPTSQAKSLKWDTRKGRWGVTLNLEQPDTRDMQWNDVQAGAYFRVTPSLRIGGAVALGDKPAPGYKKLAPEEAAPRVRLETAFKF